MVIRNCSFGTDFQTYVQISGSMKTSAMYAGLASAAAYLAHDRVSCQQRINRAQNTDAYPSRPIARVSYKLWFWTDCSYFIARATSSFQEFLSHSCSERRTMVFLGVSGSWFSDGCHVCFVSAWELLLTGIDQIVFHALLTFGYGFSASCTHRCMKFLKFYQMPLDKLLPHHHKTEPPWMRSSSLWSMRGWSDKRQVCWGR